MSCARLAPRPRPQPLPLLLVLVLLTLAGVAAGLEEGQRMDPDEIHFIPKVTTTTTTTPHPSTPASHLPSVLTSLDIPPAYLEEILRPHTPPQNDRNLQLHQYLELQTKSEPQHRSQTHAEAPPSGKYFIPQVHHTDSLQDSVYKAEESQKQEHGRISEEVSVEVPQSALVHKDEAEARGGKKGDEEENSRWKWGWWNEEPHDAMEEEGGEATPGPRFDRTLARKVTVQEGKTAVLACRVLDNNEKAVSWMRHKDLHILSVGQYKYNSDDRISVTRDEEVEEWRLTIERVSLQDAGMYQCQVATKPVLSFVVNLQVVVPEAEVLNGPEVFVHCGSLINLTCVVTHGTRRPVYVYWYHHDKVLDYEGRGGVTVITQASNNTVSHLLMRNATPSDSGTYSCTPSNGRRATATIHVLHVAVTAGEQPAAMQSAAGARSPRPPLLALGLASLLRLCTSRAADP